ncbi:dTDP-4-dehydrorhamnose reductase family protein [Fusobacterium pseudoperiodonticum]|uniref:dTDP-4-dehydrorhamnose reductase family protein n=1 Tax=Fusobacterium pseudoperiodonticum TaxID=2663009 RepID=UPI000C1B56C4|nr:SDR family oxidoreductase [Fusobacterium pseudoperiodonticum]PIM77164.1 NAD(P)-dependent oxidoreductase [Fusobacterium pseudoperiodonticum]
MKILILGSSGMLGRELVNVFIKKKHEVYGIDINDIKNLGNKYSSINLLNEIEVKQFLEKNIFDIIINSVAIVDLKKCEVDKKLAEDLHVNLNKNFIEYCNKNNTKYIYISTDSVFDGEIGNYKEDSLVKPLNNYAYTKFLGEKEVEKIKNHMIVRTNILGYTENQNSLFKWAYENLKDNIEINGFEDVIFSPISVFRLSEIISRLVEINYQGLINVVNDTVLSKYEFLNILKEMISSNSKINRVKIQNIDIIRPKNTSLNNELLHSILKNLNLDLKKDMEKILFFIKN